jgi:hypothetical protein
MEGPPTCASGSVFPQILNTGEKVTAMQGMARMPERILIRAGN